MFLILLNYTKPISEVERLLGAHREFLEQHYASGRFLLSGRKEPRTGGVILADAASRAEVQSIIHRDPFFEHAVAEYQVIEFLPSAATAELAHLTDGARR